MKHAWIAALALIGSGAMAQPAPCQAQQYRQFDFWLGSWDVYGVAGKKVGESRIEAFAGGCGVAEFWSAVNGVSGRSLNMYDATDKQWHQAWVDSSGSRLLLDGELRDGQMVLRSGTGAVRQQVTWSRNPDGSVRQFWQSSTDGGATWSTAFDGKYVKKNSPAE